MLRAHQGPMKVPCGYMLRPLGPPPATPAAGLSPSTSSARSRQGGPLGPWSVHAKPNTRPWPRPLAWAPWPPPAGAFLCWRVVDAGPKPTASVPARPLRPAAGARGHGPVDARLVRACAPDHRAKHGRPLALQLRPSAATAAPSRSERDRDMLAEPARRWLPGCFNGRGEHAANPRPLLKQAGPRVPLN